MYTLTLKLPISTKVPRTMQTIDLSSQHTNSVPLTLTIGETSCTVIGEANMNKEIWLQLVIRLNLWLPITLNSSWDGCDVAALIYQEYLDIAHRLEST